METEVTSLHWTQEETTFCWLITEGEAAIHAQSLQTIQNHSSVNPNLYTIVTPRWSFRMELSSPQLLSAEVLTTLPLLLYKNDAALSLNVLPSCMNCQHEINSCKGKRHSITKWRAGHSEGIE